MEELGVAEELLAFFCFLRAVTIVWVLGHQHLYVSTRIKTALAGRGAAERNSIPSLLPLCVLLCVQICLFLKGITQGGDCPKWDRGDVPFPQSAKPAFRHTGLYV